MRGKHLYPKKFWVRKFFGSENILGSKFVWPEKVLVQKIKARKKVGSKIFGKNWVGSSGDIPNLNKDCQDKCHCESWHLLKMGPEAYLLSLVNIRSVIDEIFNIAKLSSTV